MSFERNTEPEQNPNFGWLEADYRDMVEAIREAVDTSESAAADLEDGGRFFAALLPPKSEFGAEKDDHCLVLTIEERKLDGEGNKKSYRLTMSYLDSNREEYRGREWDEFHTNPTKKDISEHNEDTAREWRSAIEVALGGGLFNSMESWFRVESKAANMSEDVAVARAMAYLAAGQQPPGYDPDAT